MRTITAILAFTLALVFVASAQARADESTEAVAALLEFLAELEALEESEDAGAPAPLPMMVPGPYGAPGYVGPGYQHDPSRDGYDVFGMQESYGAWDQFRSNGGHTGGSNSWNNNLTNSYGGSSGDFGYVCTDSGCVTY